MFNPIKECNQSIEDLSWFSNGFYKLLRIWIIWFRLIAFQIRHFSVKIKQQLQVNSNCYPKNRK